MGIAIAAAEEFVLRGRGFIFDAIAAKIPVSIDTSREAAMNQLVQGTYSQGQIVLESAVDWPEGSRVAVSLSDLVSLQIGLREEEWSDSPDAIADWLRWFDNLEPIETTPSEDADLADWRRQIKQHTIERMHSSVDGNIE